MVVPAKKTLILLCLLSLAIPLYAQNEANDNFQTQSITQEEKITQKNERAQKSDLISPAKKAILTFVEFINRTAYAALTREEEEKILR